MYHCLKRISMLAFKCHKGSNKSSISMPSTMIIDDFPKPQIQEKKREGRQSLRIRDRACGIEAEPGNQLHLRTVNERYISVGRLSPKSEPAEHSFVGECAMGQACIKLELPPPRLGSL
ncbi:predicted protein [Arabidopsis lyrata subsp. lyrata]|uniref:Predicted protein n=1 Tax=Arabidopsis lyrata subsp. lyrata TaxID=81972 RepID=D7KB20_ARALL|nr:predicted protein [Arabidopsis lyrata subsp. lyrata]